jgi:hypothetical protein
MGNKELRANILVNLLRAVVAITPLGNCVTYIEDSARIAKLCEDEESWLEMCSSLCDLIHDFV